MDRIDPLGPAQAYKTYGAIAPVRTHFRPATCSEVDCPDYINGWRVRIEGLPPQLLHDAKTSGRRYKELHVQQDENYLVFEAGQPCFRASTHRKRLDRDFRYFVADGDWRGLANTRVHTRFTFWQEEFALQQNMIAARRERG